MLDHVSRCFDSEREISQHLLLQAIWSLEGISQGHSHLLKLATNKDQEILQDDVSLIAGDTKRVLQSLSILHEVLFRRDLQNHHRSISQHTKNIDTCSTRDLAKSHHDTATVPTSRRGRHVKRSLFHDLYADEIMGDAGEVKESVVEAVACPKCQVPARDTVQVIAPLHVLAKADPSNIIAKEIVPHSASSLLLNLPELLRDVRRVLERHYADNGGIPPTIIAETEAWETTFQIERSSLTDSIWNSGHQEHRVEAFEASDYGVSYRLRCICLEGALHSLDVYCPKNLPSETSTGEDLERDSEAYIKQKTKRMSSPEPSVTEDESSADEGENEAENEEESKGEDDEAVAAREAAELKKEMDEKKQTAVSGVMGMVGLPKVKEHIQKLEAKVQTSARQGLNLKEESFSTILIGNPGTGKTTFARQYAEYLYAAGLVATDNVKETSGIYLADGGITRIKNYIEGLEDSGGILFIDDAHFLLSSDHCGVKVLDYLLQSIPTHHGKIVFILSGSEKGMQKLIGHGNRSMSLMFPYMLQFKDYDDGELVQLMKQGIEMKWKGKMMVEGGLEGLYMRIAARRLGRGRGSSRFGNARAVAGLLSTIWDRQSARRGVERDKVGKARKGSLEAKKSEENIIPKSGQSGTPTAAPLPEDSSKNGTTVPSEVEEQAPGLPPSNGKVDEPPVLETNETCLTSQAEAKIEVADGKVLVEVGDRLEQLEDISKLADVEPAVDLAEISSVTVKAGESAENDTTQDSNAKVGTETSKEDSEDETKDEFDPEDYIFTKDDILGSDPSKAVLSSPAWTKLEKLTGLEKVKESILSLLELVKANYQREMEEKPLLKVSLNRLFLGPPGTGKTLVAKLYGQLLAEIGILSKGEVLLRNPSDLLGQYIGDSEANTKAALNAAMGNVLVIDEAYMMYSGGADGTGNESDSYRQGIVDTLVGEIQSEPGEDRCVLLLGYDSAIEEMLQNSNPGLSRRFPLSDAFRFQNFTLPELESILRSKLSEHDLSAAEDAISVAMSVLEKARSRVNFGNGGEVENLISKAKTNYQARISHLPIPSRPKEWVFFPQDFDPEFDRGQSATSNLRKLFTDVVGCEPIIKKLETYQRVCLAMKTKSLDPRPYIPTNFIFKGPPGTGKTTTARKIAQVYYDMGLLADPSVVECSASDLIGKYIGHSGPKTTKVFEKALGKVLFIDEAYRLADSTGWCTYNSEVVSELVDLLTKPKFHGNLIVILAGYEDEMNHLLTTNPGLASRFPDEIIFGNLSPGQCLEILKMKVEKTGIEVPVLEGKREGSEWGRLMRVMVGLVGTTGWGNARDVETVAKGVCREVFARFADGVGEEGRELVARTEVVMRVLEGMLRERRKRGGENVSGGERVVEEVEEVTGLGLRPEVTLVRKKKFLQL